MSFLSHLLRSSVDACGRNCPHNCVHTRPQMSACGRKSQPLAQSLIGSPGTLIDRVNWANTPHHCVYSIHTIHTHASLRTRTHTHAQQTQVCKSSKQKKLYANALTRIVDTLEFLCVYVFVFVCARNLCVCFCVCVRTHTVHIYLKNVYVLVCVFLCLCTLKINVFVYVFLCLLCVCAHKHFWIFVFVCAHTQ